MTFFFRHKVHELDITTTGLLSSIPYLVRFLTGIFFGFVGDVLLKKKILTPNAIRKLFTIFCKIFVALDQIYNN